MDDSKNDFKSKSYGSHFIPHAKNSFPLDPWHSTPVKKKQKDDASMAIRTTRSLYSPPNHQASLSVTDTTQVQANKIVISTIQKQRVELQLLIAELKDRDQELNSMAASHQRQITSWDQDRKRVLSLEQKCVRSEEELRKRNDVIRVISKRLKLSELSEKHSHSELSNIQQQLQELSQRQEHSGQKHQDLEEKNQSLNSTILALSSQVGQLQVHEEELKSMLKLKDKDLVEATNQILALTDRLRIIETSLKDSQAHESKMLREMEEYKRRYRETRRDNAQLKAEFQEKTLESNTQREELIRLKQENQILRNELALAGEGESWKDDLISLARSKQERTESELLCLRQICENQQTDLQLMKLELESSKESLRQGDGQKTLERVDNVTGASVLEHSTHPEADLGKSLGEHQSKNVDIPPQHHLKQRENLTITDPTLENIPTSHSVLTKHEFTCIVIEDGINSKTPVSGNDAPSSEPGPAVSVSHCCECSHESENQEVADGKTESEVDFIAIINHGEGKDDSLLLVDVSSKDLQHSCTGSMTCVYVDCCTSSPRLWTNPGFSENSALNNGANSSQQQEELISSTSRLQRLLAESQQMVASLERSSEKPLSGTQSLTSTSNRTLSPALSTTSQSNSFCSFQTTQDNSDCRNQTQSPKNSREGLQRREDREGESEVQNTNSF